MLPARTAVLMAAGGAGAAAPPFDVGVGAGEAPVEGLGESVEAVGGAAVALAEAEEEVEAEAEAVWEAVAEAVAVDVDVDVDVLVNGVVPLAAGATEAVAVALGVAGLVARMAVLVTVKVSTGPLRLDTVADAVKVGARDPAGLLLLDAVALLEERGSRLEAVALPVATEEPGRVEEAVAVPARRLLLAVALPLPAPGLEPEAVAVMERVAVGTAERLGVAVVARVRVPEAELVLVP